MQQSFILLKMFGNVKKSKKKIKVVKTDSLKKLTRLSIALK